MAKDKKTETKKNETKKNETKKVVTKKAEPKKNETKKVVTKKAEPKKVTTKQTKSTTKESLLKGIKKEIKLIKWPEKKDIIKYTITTIIFCIIVALFFVLLTYLLSVVKGI